MTPALRLQGRWFCAIASAGAIVSLIGFRLTPIQEIVVAGALISMLGMPHGAFDVVVARKLFGFTSIKGWALFGLTYLSLSVTVVGFWYLAPTPFLCTFLAFSALHFGGDPAKGASILLRCLYGGAVIVLPALLHGPELQQLLGLVAGPASAAVVAPVLSKVAGPWLFAIAVAFFLQVGASRTTTWELTALAAVSLLAPPLIGFTIYFCAMHSPRHMLRTLANLPDADRRNSVALVLWSNLFVLAALAVIGWLTIDVAIASGLMQLIFVSLAALTLPHMMLLEGARRWGVPARN